VVIDHHCADGVCVQCGLVTERITYTIKLSDKSLQPYYNIFKGGGKSGKYVPYFPPFYFNELLRQRQGTGPAVPVEVMESLKDYFNAGNKRVEELSQFDIRTACKKIGKSRLMERWLQIYIRLNDVHPSVVSLPQEVVFYIKIMFDKYQRVLRPLLKMTKLGPRKVLLSYPYVLIQFYRILDHFYGVDEMAKGSLFRENIWYYSLYKPESLKKTDELWKVALSAINLSENQSLERIFTEDWPYLPLHNNPKVFKNYAIMKLNKFIVS